MLTPAFRKRIRRIQPFVRLSTTTLQRLFDHAAVLELPRKSVLFRKGERAEFLHVVIAGSIGLGASTENPARTIVEIFRKDSMFVAPAVILQMPYLVSAVALTPSRVLTIPAVVLLPLLDHDLDLARGMVDVLAGHWRLLIEQIQQLKLRSATQRLAAYLLELSGSRQGRHPIKIELLEPHRSLAARLGMTHENFSRAFVELREHGVKKTSRNTVQIIAPGRLREFANSLDDARGLLRRRAQRI